MTQAQSTIHWDSRTHVLSREGRILTLGRLHSGIFGAVWSTRDQGTISTKDIAPLIGCSPDSVRLEMPRINRKLETLGMHIEGVSETRRRRGRRLVVDAMPKWEPKVNFETRNAEVSRPLCNEQH
jgi:hypothetical protein